MKRQKSAQAGLLDRLFSTFQWPFAYNIFYMQKRLYRLLERLYRTSNSDFFKLNTDVVIEVVL